MIELDKKFNDSLNYILFCINKMDISTQIKTINSIREKIHEISPFKEEPVDFVKWLPKENIIANDYNPNKVAPPEMELLKKSIEHDGYTQPIVAWHEFENIEVVDGFHRTKVCNKFPTISERVHGHLPIVIIKDDCSDRNNRIASTIRHNRARGKHVVEGMSEIVIELKRRNWSDKRIGKELGMDADEVLRLTQISGLSEMFKDKEFSHAWEHSGELEAFGDIEESSNDLEWMNNLIVLEHKVGWNDRTEQSSVLYGEKNQQRGTIQRSRFNDEWFWYAYTQPMQYGRTEKKNEAKKIIEDLVNET
jgi:hypothetical protein